MMEMTTDKATKAFRRGDKFMIRVYGDGVDGPVDIALMFDRKFVPEYINKFRERFPKDPVDMAEMTLRNIMLVAGEIPPHVREGVIAPALVLASSGPHGIGGAFAIEISVRENDVLVDVSDWKTPETVH